MQKQSLQIYRSMLKLAKRLETPSRELTFKQIQTEFRANIGVTDENDVRKLISDAQGRISYLKMITPKAKIGVSSSFHKTYGQSEMSVSRKPMSNWNVSSLLDS